MNAQIQWPTVLQVQGKPVDAEIIERQYRLLARKRHPDAGGSNEAMTELNLAKEAALKWITEQALAAQQAEAARIAAKQAEMVFRNVYQQHMSANAQANAANSWLGGLGGMGSGLGNMGAQSANAAANGNSEWLHQSTKEDKRKTKWDRVKEILRGER